MSIKFGLSRERKNDRQKGKVTYLLLLVIFVQIICNNDNILISASPIHLLKARAKKYFELENQVFDLPSGSLENLSRETTDISIWTETMQKPIVKALQKAVAEMQVIKQDADFSECVQETGTNQRCFKVPKAYLRISKIAECNFYFVLCCPLYWVTDDQPANLPQKFVREETFFWDGQKAINDFFTNFTIHDTSVDCAKLQSAEERYKEMWLNLNYVAVDSTGAWSMVSNVTKSALREKDITNNFTARAEANSAFGQDPSQIVTKQKQIYGTISLRIAIIVNVISLAVIIVILTVVYFFSYHPICKLIESKKCLLENSQLLEGAENSSTCKECNKSEYETNNRNQDVQKSNNDNNGVLYNQWGNNVVNNSIENNNNVAWNERCRYEERPNVKSNFANPFVKPSSLANNNYVNSFELVEPHYNNSSATTAADVYYNSGTYNNNNNNNNNSKSNALQGVTSNTNDLLYPVSSGSNVFSTVAENKPDLCRQNNSDVIKLKRRPSVT